VANAHAPAADSDPPPHVGQPLALKECKAPKR
jgi:hypothetical protein